MSQTAYGFFGKCSKQSDGVEVHYFGGGARCLCGERIAAATDTPKPNLRLVDPPQQEDGRA